MTSAPIPGAEGPVDVGVRREQLSSAAAVALVTALNAELSGRYPSRLDCHFDLAEEEVEAGRGMFVVASIGDTDVGCGAVRLIDDDVAELKRMFVVPEFRGRRIAAVVLCAREDETRALGANRVVLETGIRSPEALALYGRAGYHEIERFGPFVASSVSVCMARTSGQSEPSPSRVPAPPGGSLRGLFDRHSEFLEVRHA
jgi:GNAT superfamily N-acetyltransferase